MLRSSVGNQRIAGWRAALTATLPLLALLCLLAATHAPPTPDEVRRLNETGPAADAEKAARALLRAVEERSGTESLEAAEALDQLALALRRGGKSGQPEARSVCERAIRIKERTVGTDDARYAASLHNLGLLLYQRGELDSADVVLSRALEIREKTLGENHPDVAWSLIAVGATRTDRGDFASAKAPLDRAVEIQKTALAPDDPERAIGLLALGSLDFEIGALSEAMRLFEESVAVCERSAVRDLPLLGSCYQNLGAVLSEIGDRERARKTYQRALQVREESLGAEHPALASTLLNLGDEALHAGDTAGARAYLERALRIVEKAFGASHQRAGWARMKLGLVDLAAGDTAGAGAMLRRALEIQEKALGPDHPDLWQTLLGLAEVETAGGDFRRARGYYERTLSLLETAYGPSNIDLGSSLCEFASFLLQAGDSAAALEASLRASRVNGEQLRLISHGLAERQALVYARTLGSSLDVALAVLAGERYRSNPSTIREVWNTVVRWRAVILDEVASRNRTINAAEGLADKARQLEAARQRLANLMVRGPSGEDPERYRALINTARDEMERAERDLGATSAAFRSGETRGRVGLEEVISAVPSATALVAFSGYEARAGRSTLAFVLTAAHRPVVVPLGSSKEIDALVDEWTALVAAGPDAPGGRRGAAERDCRSAGANLRSRIWDPLAPYLADARRIFIVPEGSLHLVNLGALPVGKADYLVESAPLLHYLSAERDLVRIATEGAAGIGLLALGGPSFDSRVEPPAPDSVEVAQGGTRADGSADKPVFRGAPPDCASFRSAHFEPLPESVEEVREIASVWNRPDQALVLTGAGATERAFKRLAPGRRVLHLATHGFFLNGRCGGDPHSRAIAVRGIGGLAPAGEAPGAPRARVEDDENPLHLSGIALAGANRRGSAGPDEEDGILTAEEIASLDLSQVEWAVLSACDTGVGEIQAGEGVLGLRRAFQVAGASTLILSLWPVEDRSAREWMKTLYKAKFGRKMETDEAVREASLGVLRERRARALSTHPFYWAAFVAAGDWR